MFFCKIVKAIKYTVFYINTFPRIKKKCQSTMDLNDLCKLDNVDEESVIEIIRKRYENGLFYVRTFNS